MKLDRLRTLSQFVDSTRARIEHNTGIFKPEDINAKNVDSWNTETIHGFGRIEKYNKLLKQPITKDMFVNPYDKPTKEEFKDNLFCISGNCKAYRDMLEEWQASEKKVIFKNVTYVDLQPSQTYNSWNINGHYIANHMPNGEANSTHKNLHELAEITKGELELQNVEL